MCLKTIKLGPLQAKAIWGVCNGCGGPHPNLCFKKLVTAAIKKKYLEIYLSKCFFLIKSL